jgi:hypothetical protein
MITASFDGGGKSRDRKLVSKMRALARAKPYVHLSMKSHEHEFARMTIPATSVAASADTSAACAYVLIAEHEHVLKRGRALHDSFLHD